MEIEKLSDLFRTFNCYRRCIIESHFKENGIYIGQPPILEYLARKPDSTQKEIAEHLGISPASIAVSVKRMEKSGLVVRVSDKSDARRNNLRITEKGIELLEFSHRTFDKMDCAMIKDFTDGELEMLLNFLDRMNKNLLSVIEEKEDDNV